MTISNKSDQINYDHEGRIIRLETLNDNISQTLIRLENKIDKLDSRIDKLEDKIESRFDKLSNRIWINFYWTIGGFASILLILAHGFKWI